MSTKSGFAITPLAAAISAALAPATAVQAQEDGVAALEEIIVTARKREEHLQDIPADVQAISEAMLQKIGAIGLEDYTRFIPSMNVVSAFPGDATIIFRGVNTGRRAGGSITARAAFAPDGSEIARYYFPEGDALPVLREEDASRDGEADRWIAYQGDARTEIWEDGGPAGRPDLRLVFSVGGRRLLRVEVDRDRNGRPERVFHYSAGTLTAEARDRDGDGQLDTFDRLDADGSLAVREEDLDGDGEIDVRSHYQDGKLRRREL